MYQDRVDAGIQLAEALIQYQPYRPVVLGLARGGVVPAAEVARRLRAPLDLIVVRKIAHPLWPEYAIGAVTETGVAVWGQGGDAASGSWRTEREAELQQLALHLHRRCVGSREAVSCVGRTAILVDDGIATGLSMLAAVREARRRGAETVVVAAPVAPREFSARLESEADSLELLSQPAHGFSAVSQFYEHFQSVSDEEVRQLMSAYHFPDTAAAIDLPSLNAVLATIHEFPVSSRSIARRAKRQGAPPSVVGFFESIPGGTTFENKTDVINRSLGAEKLREDELSEPYERPMPDD